MDKMTLTNRGFGIYEFEDTYGIKCSLQKSSLATEDRIWLGADENRMHLDQKQAEELVEILQKFVETGDL